ncbi:Uncharacterised protein [Mycobacteroides abscessus subsp. massiliense]|nr:Uncharacterised protein [Mycobacteroides abscessus subsp. massiliense]
MAHQDVRARSERRQQRIQIPGDAFQRAWRGIVIAASQIGAVVDHRPKPLSDKGLHQTPCDSRSQSGLLRIRSGLNQAMGSDACCR